MKDIIIRVQSLTIEGFKSVSKGAIIFDNQSNLSSRAGFLHGNVKGLYGPNGSGKTSAVEIFQLFQKIWQGSAVHEYAQWISSEDKKANLKVTLSILDENENRIIQAAYTIGLQAVEIAGQMRVHLIHELLETASKDLNAVPSKFGLKSKFKLVRPLNSETKLTLAPRLLQKVPGTRTLSQIEANAFANPTDSALFSKIGYSFITTADHPLKNKSSLSNQDLECIKRYEELVFSIKMLHQFSKRHLRIFESSNLCSTTLPPNLVMKEEVFLQIVPVLKQIDLILNSLIPAIHFTWRTNPSIRSDGIREVNIKFYTQYSQQLIPLECESAGIKRLASISKELSVLFNTRNCFLLIDEFDDKIFEYLLGELLEVIEENAKGQFLFTAHNLRPFEVLKPKNIILATADSSNRFIPLPKIQKNNNARDVYYRILTLGSTDVDLYNQTRTGKIRNSLLKAGELANISEFPISTDIFSREEYCENKQNQPFSEER